MGRRTARRAAAALPALAALLAWAAASRAHACPLPADEGQRLAANGVELAWRAQPSAPRVGQPFTLHVRLCPADAVLRRVDAVMPEHRHGMNYRASIRALGDGRSQVQGLLWHMSGRWELRFEVLAAGATHELRQTVDLP